MRALSTALPVARRLLRNDGLQRWFVHEPSGHEGQARIIRQLTPSSALDADLSERWLAVAARNAPLAHAGCTQIEDWGVHEGSAYVVSLSPAGVSLGALLAAVQASGTRLAAQLVAPIGIMILEALDYALQCDPSLTHLDLDLDGITVSPDGSVVLSEFALWSVLSPAEIARCRFDSGRVQYCAPELMQSRRADCRSDVFSVGGLLYHLLTGERPFTGATQLLIALAIADGKRSPLHQRASAVPEGLCEVVEVMLTTNAEERFQSPGAAAAALRSTVCARDQHASTLASAGLLPAGAAEVITKMFVAARSAGASPKAPPRLADAPSGAPCAAPVEPRAGAQSFLHAGVEKPPIGAREPAPPPMCFPVPVGALRDAPRVAPGSLRRAELPASHGPRAVDDVELSAEIPVNDGRTAYLRVRPAQSSDRQQECSDREPSQPPLRMPSASPAKPLFEPERELALSPSSFRASADVAWAPHHQASTANVSSVAWSSVAKQDKWTEPSDTVFGLSVRPAAHAVRSGRVSARGASSREPKGSQLRALWPVSTVFAILALVALYLVYRLLS